MGSINQAQRRIVTVRVMNQPATMDWSDLEICVDCSNVIASKSDRRTVAPTLDLR